MSFRSRLVPKLLVLILLTLGAAYGEAGDFKSAVHYQKKLVETASAEEKTELVRILRLYESRSPLRE